MIQELFFLLGYIKGGGKFKKPLSKEEEADILIRMSKGDEDARATLVEHNLRLVAHIAGKYSAGQDIDELISVGSIGLIKAARTFDIERGRSFAGYAARCIENELLMRFRSEKKKRSELSLEDPIATDREGNDITLMDLIAADGESVDETALRNITLDNIRSALSSLTPRERVIMKLRYGLDGGTPLTQKEAGQRLGISRSYVSRIEKKAIEELRAKLE